MYSLLLKKAIPFALTFVIGSLVGGLFKFFVPGAQTAERPRAYYYGYGEGRSGCKHSRGRYLVAESKPLNIINMPDASVRVRRDSLRRGTGLSVLAVVTFGADGKVKGVESASLLSACGMYKTGQVSGDVLEAVRNAAVQIQFEPEMLNGMPVTVVKEIEISVLFN
jgi:hypothetical protein